MDIPEFKDNELETVYFEGNGPDFVIHIKSLGDNAELASVGGKFRWIINTDDGKKYILRPHEARP